MECLVAIVTTHPLALHVSLYNPPTAATSLHVPRSLKPLGAFMHVEVRDRSGTLVYETQPPKFAPKLEVSHAESYVALEPGYSYGVLLECDAPPLPPGDYRVEVSYSNLQFRGFSDHFIGDQRCHTLISITVGPRDSGTA
jgi:hypothetical protein